jgi:hypothetical protein
MDTKETHGNKSIKTHCLIVTHEEYTFMENLIDDLLKQDVNFNLTIVDNNSSDKRLHALYDKLNTYSWITIIKNNFNKPLNHVWNWFHENTSERFLCYLNNDVRVPRNFISDSERLFAEQPNVAITIHATNHPSYLANINFKYELLDSGWQGWDFTIRRECYPTIPLQFKWYSGDGYIYSDLIFKQKRLIGVLLSSPILHYQGTTGRKFNKKGILSKKDSMEKIKLGYKNPERKNKAFYVLRPTFNVEKIWLKNYKH